MTETDSPVTPSLLLPIWNILVFVFMWVNQHHLFVDNFCSHFHVYFQRFNPKIRSRPGCLQILLERTLPVFILRSTSYKCSTWSSGTPMPRESPWSRLNNNLLLVPYLFYEVLGSGIKRVPHVERNQSDIYPLGYGYLRAPTHLMDRRHFFSEISLPSRHLSPFSIPDPDQSSFETH